VEKRLSGSGCRSGCGSVGSKDEADSITTVLPVMWFSRPTGLVWARPWEKLIAIQVHCMCANYAIWGGGSGGPEDDFFPVGCGSPMESGKF